MTEIYIAYSIATPAVKTMRAMDWRVHDVNLLASFYYIDDFNRQFKDIPPAGHTMLDSGAFSAYNSGKQVNIDELIAEAQSGRWDEVVALDVIKNAPASLKNSLYMKEKGCHVMPVFHIGEPFEFLDEYCKQFGRVGLSCRFGETEKQSYQWLDECFKRYPKGFHSFGWISEKMLMTFPFQTGDSSSWALAPQAYKHWRSYGGRLMIKTTHGVSLLPEVEWYVQLQRRLRHRWKNEMRRLDELPNARKQSNPVQAV